MKAAVFIALGFLIYLFVCYWVATHIRYRISQRYFRVLLFGICLRRVALSEIESVSKRRPAGWAEKWVNTFQPSHRTLAIRRIRGLRRCIVITPKNRNIFKAALEKAIRQLSSPTDEEEENVSLMTA